MVPADYRRDMDRVDLPILKGLHDHMTGVGLVVHLDLFRRSGSERRGWDREVVGVEVVP